MKWENEKNIAIILALIQRSYDEKQGKAQQHSGCYFQVGSVCKYLFKDSVFVESFYPSSCDFCCLTFRNAYLLCNF